MSNCERDTALDLGIKHFATLSTGEKIPNPKYLRKYEGQLKRAQRVGSHPLRSPSSHAIPYRSGSHAIAPTTLALSSHSNELRYPTVGDPFRDVHAAVGIDADAVR